MQREILKHKNCLITGATGGLGRQIALIMGQHGSNLFLTSRNARLLSKLKQELETAFGQDIKVSFEVGDLRNLDLLKGIIATVRQKFGTIDILVNCAGVFPVKPIAKTTLEDFEDCFNINVRAAFILAKEFSRDMLNNRWGRIVNIGSSSAYYGFKNTSIYCASKHALLGLSRSLHDELKEYNVRTFCISPGSMKTQMGKLVKNQDFETFILPREIAEFIAFTISFNDKMVSQEIRLDRMVIR